MPGVRRVWRDHIRPDPLQAHRQKGAREKGVQHRRADLMGLSKLRVPRTRGNHAPTAREVDRRKPGRLQHRRAFLLAQCLLVPMDAMGKDRPQIFAGKGRAAKAESCLQHAAGRTLGRSRRHYRRGHHAGTPGGLRNQRRRIPGGAAGGRACSDGRRRYTGRPHGIRDRRPRPLWRNLGH